MQCVSLKLHCFDFSADQNCESFSCILLTMLLFHLLYSFVTGRSVNFLKDHQRCHLQVQVGIVQDALKINKNVSTVLRRYFATRLCYLNT